MTATQTNLTTNETKALAKRRVDWFNTPVDVLESDQNYLILADLPGVSKEAIRIEAQDGALRIEAEQGHRMASDAITGFRRLLRIGNDIDPEGITASVDRGILRLLLPKLQARQPRRIEVQAA
jgi:HSP20 family molecular chaperone IbpA